jgi:hypothetical protein
MAKSYSVDIPMPNAPTKITTPEAPTMITGLSNDYFTNQRNQMVDQLRQEFFGPLGKVQATASGESAAGRLGSGVGKRVIQETAMRPFAEGMGKIGQDVVQAQMQEQARVDTQNANLMSSYRDQLQRAREFNATQDNTYNELSSKVNMAKAGLLNDYQIAELNAKIQAYIADEETATKMADIEMRGGIGHEQNQIEFLNVMGQFPEVATNAPGMASAYGYQSAPLTNAQKPPMFPSGQATGQFNQTSSMYGMTSADGQWVTDGSQWYPQSQWRQIQSQRFMENR